MKYLTASALFLAVLFCTLGISAQDTTVEMADVMRSNGKIYVVVAVILVILLTLFGYLIRLDRRLKKIEDQQKHS